MLASPLRLALLVAIGLPGCASPVPQDERPDLLPGPDLARPWARHDLAIPRDLAGPALDEDLALSVADAEAPDLTRRPDDAGCGAPFLACDAGCIDPELSPTNCGGCGINCQNGQLCLGGQCACTAKSCAGCCLGNLCLPGNTAQACGGGGAACKACGNGCVNGGCAGCKPGTVETAPCGNCGQKSRTCDGNGNWGAFGGCQNEGPCAPGAKATAKCGNCGTRTDTCGQNCQWQTGSCQGAGPCAPGATDAGNCDGCAHKVCNQSCQWSACTLKPGNTCEWRKGTNTRACQCKTACGGTPLQWCLPSCTWSTDCACCGVNTCPRCN